MRATVVNEPVADDRLPLDPRRRVERADASITDLAGKFDMTLTGMKKHVAVLEQAGLVMTAADKRTPG